MVRSYIGRVFAHKGKFLLGGARNVSSSRFETRDQANAWIEAICDNQRDKVLTTAVIRSYRAPEILEREAIPRWGLDHLGTTCDCFPC